MMNLLFTAPLLLSLTGFTLATPLRRQVRKLRRLSTRAPFQVIAASPVKSPGITNEKVVSSIVPTNSRKPSGTPGFEFSAIPSIAPHSTYSQRPNVMNVYPSKNPTYPPSDLSSSNPTFQPSRKLNTLRPSLHSSDKDSLKPTFQPSKSSIMATKNPTTKPSSQPFVNSGTPHGILSTTAKPSINTILNKEPTLVPSTITSVQFPSIMTTFEPRVTPKPTVSKVITMSPSIEPTYVPSQSQSIRPTKTTSLKPSIENTLYPSMRPTIFINSHPSLTPSIGPSVDPSEDPSTVPSMVPSEKPTTLAAQQTSIGPTMNPSVVPSLIPTTFLSGIPSLNSTDPPTLHPTADPTIALSISPTISVSPHPNFNPSIQPVASATTEPSVISSIESTSVLSENPTDEFVTLRPNLNPIMSPSTVPTSKPKQRPPTNIPINDNPTFESNAPGTDDDDRSTSGAMLIGGISAGVGFVGLLTLATLALRQQRSEDSMVNTLGSEETMSSLPRSSHLPDIGDSDTIRANETFSGDNSDHNNYNDTEGNENMKDITLCNFSYSEDSSEVFKDLGMSLTSSSAASSRISRFSFSDIDLNQCALDMHHQENLPLQQLRPETNITSIERHNDNIEQDSTSLGEASILKTEILQPDSKNLVRLLSCFSSTSLLNNINNTTAQTKTNHEKVLPVQSITHNKAEVGRGPDFISVVSSLSGRSLSTESTIDFYQGEPYEVLVSGDSALGLVVKSSQVGPQIVHIKQSSPLYQVVEEGDYILSVDGIDTRHISAKTLSKWLHKTNKTAERTIIFMGKKTSYHGYGKRLI